MKHLYLVHNSLAFYNGVFCKGLKVAAGINKFGTPISTPHLHTSNHLCIFQDSLDNETVTNQTFRDLAQRCFLTQAAFLMQVCRDFSSHRLSEALPTYSLTFCSTCHGALECFTLEATLLASSWSSLASTCCLAPLNCEGFGKYGGTHSEQHHDILNHSVKDFTKTFMSHFATTNLVKLRVTKMLLQNKNNKKLWTFSLEWCHKNVWGKGGGHWPL